MLKKLCALSFVSLLFLQTSCAHAPPDVPVCTELEPNRAACVKTMSGEEFTIDDEHPFEGKTWWDMRPAVLSMPASSWAKIKAWIIEICHTSNQCGSTVGNWEQTLDTVDSNIETKLP